MSPWLAPQSAQEELPAGGRLADTRKLLLRLFRYYRPLSHFWKLLLVLVMFTSVPRVPPHSEKHVVNERVSSDSGLALEDLLRNTSYGFSFFGHSRLPHLVHQGAVITPTMDHTMSMQPASMMGPITQQMNHLSLGTTGSVSTKHVINLVVRGALCLVSLTQFHLFGGRIEM